MYKKLSENFEEGLFENYNLTEIMLLAKNGKKIKANEVTALYLLLNSKLEEYGIYLFGQFERQNLLFRGIRLLDDFPIENEPIIKQLYGYTNYIPHIQLRGFDEYATAFDYNTENGKCELQRHCFGTVTHRIKYDTLKDMLLDIKEKTYDNLF